MSPELITDVDRQIDAMLDRFDWWRLPPRMWTDMETILEDLFRLGLNHEAARLLGQYYGRSPMQVVYDWQVDDPRIRQLMSTHTAEMVVNVDSGTKRYLREKIKANWHLGTTAVVEQLQKDLFTLPGREAGKLPRARLQSITNYETNRAMSAAAQLLRDELGLKFKQWWVSSVSPCEICLGNQAQGVVRSDFLYEGVFGQILHPPAHPRTCRCLAMAVESELRSDYSQGPPEMPMTRPKGTLGYPP